jgi:tRNA pseudouridine32 synthase / 23S rRNA pseudouridine746 synthase
VILFSDPSFLIINKPSGLRVIPDGYDRTLPTLLSELMPEWSRLYVVHRLDKETSGVMLLARTPDAHRHLSLQFAAHSVKKVYVALCYGIPEWQEKKIDLPLRIDGDRHHRTVLDPLKGKPACTEVRLLKKMSGLCLIEAQPKTGYTHQIRAHLALAGFPLLGDTLYRYPPSWEGARIAPSSVAPFPRTALHSQYISFLHPLTSQPEQFEIPYPDDFIDLIQD